VTEEKLPWQLTVPELKDVLVGELAERAEWVVANVEPSSFWPVNAQKMLYRGETGARPFGYCRSVRSIFQQSLCGKALELAARGANAT
jgi:hypothetical protein